MRKFNGIEGLVDPTIKNQIAEHACGAALRVGETKSVRRGSGAVGPAPSNLDRFMIVTPVRDPTGIRPGHPAYVKYNALPEEYRRSIQVRIISTSWNNAHQVKLQAWRGEQSDPSPTVGPFCHGDGVNAQRWNGSDHYDLPCPNRQCRYMRKRKCKPSAMFIFEPVWPDKASYPVMAMFWAHHSWNNASLFEQLHDMIKTRAAGLGIPKEKIGLYGATMMLNLEQHTRPERRYPVVRPSLTCDLDQVLMDNLRRREEIARLVESAPTIQSISDEEIESARVELSPNLRPR